MHGEEIFGALVRAIGLCGVLMGVWYSFGIVWPNKEHGSNAYVAITVFWVIVGVALLFGADIIVEAAY